MATQTVTIARHTGVQWESINTSFDDAVISQVDFEQRLKDNYLNQSAIDHLFNTGDVNEITVDPNNLVGTGVPKQAFNNISNDESEITTNNVNYLVSNIPVGSPVVDTLVLLCHDPASGGGWKMV